MLALYKILLLIVDEMKILLITCNRLFAFLFGSSIFYNHVCFGTVDLFFFNFNLIAIMSYASSPPSPYVSFFIYI